MKSNSDLIIIVMGFDIIFNIDSISNILESCEDTTRRHKWSRKVS